MKVKIETATTCFACGIQTHYKVVESGVMTPQEFINAKLTILSSLSNVTVAPLSNWEKKNGSWNLVAWGTPMIKGKHQGCTSVWCTIEF